MRIDPEAKEAFDRYVKVAQPQTAEEYFAAGWAMAQIVKDNPDYTGDGYRELSRIAHEQRKQNYKVATERRGRNLRMDLSA